jgi:hypothetical protein
MSDKHLTEAEAREFLTLLERVEADMDRAFSEATDQVYGDRGEDDSFEERWGAPPSTVYVEETRGKLRQFVEHEYLRDDPHDETPEDGTRPVTPDEEYTVEIPDEIEDDAAEAARDAGFADDKEEALSELKSRLAANAESGTPIVRPPLSHDEIEHIEDEKHRALAWDLDAIATAYNYATDPLTPDLARDDAGTWIRGKEQIRLQEASSLLSDAYDRLNDRIGSELEQYETSDSGRND